MRPILGLFVGESFAEVSLVHPQTQALMDQKRWYLPKQSLKVSLKNWLSTPERQPDRVIISSRYLYKLSEHRMGGSVAQVVTTGFEKWQQGTAPLRTFHFQGLRRSPSIGSPELIFSIPEKILGSGQVTQPLQVSDLENVHEKLQLTKTQKICIHFHNADKNPAHQNLASDFFKNKNYDVYIPPRTSDVDLFTEWRTNTLCAAVSGTFEELKSEMIESFDFMDSKPELFFFNSDLNLIPLTETQTQVHRLSSLFAFERALHFRTAQTLKPMMPILHLGLEDFSWIHNETAACESPWGKLSLNTQKITRLPLQPTALMDINPDGELISLGKQSYEPGPIHMGRGLKPLWVDFCPEFQKTFLESLDEKQRKLAEDRWMTFLQTGQRNSHLSAGALDSLQKKLTNNIYKILEKEVLNLWMQEQAPCSEVFVYGFFAKSFCQQASKSIHFRELNLQELATPSLLIALEGLSRWPGRLQ